MIRTAIDYSMLTSTWGVISQRYAALDSRRNKLDHIFNRGSGKLHSQACRIVLKAGDDQPPSDHYGVLVDFKCT